MLYPLCFNTIIKPKIWGREYWTLSTVPGSESVITDGFLKDNSLQEIVEVYMDELLGQHVFAEHDTFFPLLFKYIEAEDHLSVQVHPDDAHASAFGEANGKSEMWYVTSDHPDSSVILGWREEQDETQVRANIENGMLLDRLRLVRVQPGDVAYIPAGLVHSLQRNTAVIEIQQNSDTTYRVFDYNRKDAKGQSRPLHIQEALSCMNLHPTDRPLTEYDKTASEQILVTDPHFVARFVNCISTMTRNYDDLDSFVVIIALNGSLTIETAEGHTCILKQHQPCLIPAAVETIRITPLKPQTRLMEVYVPQTGK